MAEPLPFLRVQIDGHKLRLFRLVAGEPQPDLHPHHKFAGLLSESEVAYSDVKVERGAGATGAAAPEGGRKSGLRRAAVPPPILVQCATPGKRPYIHPLLAPDGCGELTENAPDDRPWLHGLSVGLNDVNGVGFWTEGLVEAHLATAGTFHPKPLLPPILRRWSDHTRVAWAVETDWHAPGEADDPAAPPMLTETQAWRLQDYGHYYLLDLIWTLAAKRALKVGGHAEGGLFLRMPFRAGVDTQAVTSEGLVNLDANGKRARWISLSMPILGREKKAQREAGIALFDHPTNPVHPTPWRVDGPSGVGPGRSMAGAWELAAGSTTTSRYRLFVFLGSTDRSAVETQWKTFAADPL